jgi:DNA-directed RNA polymerase specialized sigma24 family protein
LSRKRVPLNQNECTADFRIGVPFEQNLHMEPLVKGYASRIHCMEREDSIQELYLTLLKTLPYLSSSSSEGECIRYMQTSVENRYRSLCRSCLSEPEKDDFDSCSVSLQAPDSFDDTYYDVTAYINSYPSDSVQRKILSMYFYQDKSDAQIARKLKLSRQYVNRMKKKLILRYISENK